MKNQNIKKIGAAAISSALVFGILTQNAPYSEAKKVSKQESVYANANADGSIKDVTVADWLQDSGLLNGTLIDNSELTDITNVKGDETFTQSDKSVKWNTSGQDIYYQGKTTKKLPVQVKITYTLDGKEMSAKEMLGKSGKMEMHVTYTNNSKVTKKINGEKRTIYTPFVMGTGMILSSEHFTDIEIDHGRVINDGTNNIVVGMGVPGLAKSLGADDDLSDKIPEEFTVTADTTDFTMGNTFTFGSSSLFNEMDLDDVDKLDDLEDKLNDLTDATDKLVDGSGELSENMSLFNDKMGDLKDSIKKYNKEGIKELTNGISTLAKGGSKLANGVKDYTAGVIDFSKGTKEYIKGADKIAKGNNDLYQAVKGLPSQIQSFDTGLKTYTSSVDKMGTTENVTQLKNGTKAVSDGITTVNQNLKELMTLHGQEQQLVAALKAQLTAQGADTSTINLLEQIVAGETQYITGLENSTNNESALKQGANSVSSGVSTIMDGLSTLSQNSSTLTNASGQLNKQVPELVANINKLKKGGETLTKNDKKLKTGANKLIKSSKKMKKSTNKLNNGIKTLNKGGKTLQKTTNTLVSGIEQLESASNKLNNGANTLSDGTNEFKDEGIEKINDVYEDDFKTLLDRLKAIVNAGKDYNNFSGIGNNMDGDVKFIIETEAVDNED